MDFEIKVIDQFVNEEGSEEEKSCWNKIKNSIAHQAVLCVLIGGIIL